MNSLSLSPRLDQFRFALPKDFLPVEVEKKYAEMLTKNNNVITNPIDYLNESIQSVTIPGIADINIVQEQHGSNSINTITSNKKINVEPKHDITYTSSSNPLEMIGKDFKVSFRLNQGLYNYFMLYETIFYAICKPLSRPPLDVVYLEILDETGLIVSRIKFFDVYIDGIDGLDFSYTKIERDTGTFDVTFKFNNIDFDYVENND